MNELMGQPEFATDAFIETQLVEPPVTEEPPISSDQWALRLDVRVVDFLSGYTTPGVL